MSGHSIDAHIGSRLAKARAARAMSLQSAAELLGVSYQQVRKYEAGVNRIAASTLYRLAEFLKVEPAYFFVGLELALTGSEASSAKAEADLLNRIADAEVREKMRDLLRALGS